jgi:hypothetical protein
MAGLLNAEFACHVRVNFDPAFHKNPAFQSGFPIRISKQILLSTFSPAWKEIYKMVRSQSMV